MSVRICRQYPRLIFSLPAIPSANTLSQCSTLSQYFTLKPYPQPMLYPQGSPPPPQQDCTFLSYQLNQFLTTCSDSSVMSNLAELAMNSVFDPPEIQLGVFFERHSLGEIDFPTSTSNIAARLETSPTKKQKSSPRKTVQVKKRSPNKHKRDPERIRKFTLALKREIAVSQNRMVGHTSRSVNSSEAERVTVSQNRMDRHRSRSVNSSEAECVTVSRNRMDGHTSRSVSNAEAERVISEGVHINVVDDFFNLNYESDVPPPRSLTSSDSETTAKVRFSSPQLLDFFKQFGKERRLLNWSLEANYQSPPGSLTSLSSLDSNCPAVCHLLHASLGRSIAVAFHGN